MIFSPYPYPNSNPNSTFSLTGAARSQQLQASCLQLLRALLHIHPAAAALTVRVLGALLASPAIGSQLTSAAHILTDNDGSQVSTHPLITHPRMHPHNTHSPTSLSPHILITHALITHPLITTPSHHPSSHQKAGRGGHGLVGDILRTLVGVMPVTPARNSMDIEGQNNQQLTHQYAYQPQDVLQPLCARFPSISYTRRGPLVQMALHALGPGALPACTAVLLAHALSAYDPEAEEAPALLPSAASERKLEDAAGAPAKGLILLSRSSQRKATRAMRTSQPEEFFRLAMESILSRPGTAALSSQTVDTSWIHIHIDTSRYKTNSRSANTTSLDLLLSHSLDL